MSQQGVPQQQQQQQLRIKPITNNKGKHLIPWRQKEFKVKLETAFLKVCYLHKIHLKDTANQKNETRWRATSLEVFRQPEFAGYDGSWSTLYDKYRSILDEYAKKNGWRDENGGKTGNLSGEEGDPNDPTADKTPDYYVCRILYEQQLEEEDDEKKKKEKDQAVLAQTESALLMNGLAAKSKSSIDGLVEPNKRKRHQTSNSSSVSSKDSDQKMRRITDDELYSLLLPQGGKSAAATDVAAAESNLIKWFEIDEQSSYEKLVILSNCSDNIASTEGTLEAITFQIIANTFFQDGKGAEADYFKKEMVEYGLPKLVAHKLFVFLKKQSDELQKTFITPK